MRPLMIITQEPAESLAASDAPALDRVYDSEEIAERCPFLGVALLVVVVNVFAQGPPYRTLAKEDNLGQALLSPI
jgi:hypothetical protein